MRSGGVGTVGTAAAAAARVCGCGAEVVIAQQMLLPPLLLLLLGLQLHPLPTTAAATATRQPEAVGWWVGDITPASLEQLDKLEWGTYTIIRPQFGPAVAANGSCTCSLSKSQTGFVGMVHRRGLKVQASPNFNVTRGLPREVGGAGDGSYRAEYLRTIGAAVAECDFDGLEFDYEPLNDCKPTDPRACVMTPAHATAFTVLMADIKVAMGGNKLMSEDVGVWGLSQGSYPLLTEPWVNVSMLNAGAIDFINTMSYHHPRDGGIEPWKQDAAWLDRHGIDRGRVNIGLPYYSFNFTDNAAAPVDPAQKVVNEPTWATLSKLCPDAGPGQHICDTIAYCGKSQNEQIGQLVREQGWRGVFPWAANYDSLGDNNSLAAWLGKGLRGPSLQHTAARADTSHRAANSTQTSRSLANASRAALRECDPLQPDYCMLPFPNDFWRGDGRLAISDETFPKTRPVLGSMPVRAEAGGWNEADGFPLFPSITTYWPGLTDASIDNMARVWNPQRSLDGDSPSVIIDRETQERIAHWAEVDHMSDADATLPPEERDKRALLLWPTKALRHATTYIVALRGVTNVDGAAVAPSAAFAALRDGQPSGDPLVEERRELYDTLIFPALEAAGVARADLQLA